MNKDIAKRLATDLPRFYTFFVEEKGHRDSPTLRKTWSRAFMQGFETAHRWIALPEKPSVDGLYLIATKNEDDAAKTRLAYYRTEEDKWVWFVSGGVIEIHGVVAWQHTPADWKPESDDNGMKKYLSYLGLGTTFKSLGNFLGDCMELHGVFSDGRKWGIFQRSGEWVCEMDDLTYRTSTLVSALRWFISQKRRGRPRPGSDSRVNG